MSSDPSASGTVLPPLILLAGGLATRMRPLTETVPKSMLIVAGEPFISLQLHLFRRRGIRHVILCVGYLGEKLRDYVQDGARWDLKVDWSFDGPKLLGTGGALRQAAALAGDEFFVSYGDSWLDIDYGAVANAFHASGKPALMVVFRNEGRWDTSNIEFEAGEIRNYDKVVRTPAMRYIDYGLQLLRRGALAGCPQAGAFDLAVLYGSLIRDKQMAGFEAERRFYEIGSPAGLAETDQLLTGAIT